jgi:hypothetical protein
MTTSCPSVKLVFWGLLYLAVDVAAKFFKP